MVFRVTNNGGTSNAITSQVAGMVFNGMSDTQAEVLLLIQVFQPDSRTLHG